MAALDAVIPGVHLRPQTPQDHAFLESLFIAIRWAEFDRSGWPDDVRRQLLAGQFALQSRHYALHYDGALFLVIERDGASIGRLYLFEGADEIRIVDISLLPDASGQGLGTALLTAILAAGTAAAKPVNIHVEQFNPALRLYRRLGFAEEPAEGPYLRMEWRPAA